MERKERRRADEERARRVEREGWGRVGRGKLRSRTGTTVQVMKKGPTFYVREMFRKGRTEWDKKGKRTDEKCEG